jgi:hypothetical protein
VVRTKCAKSAHLDEQAEKHLSAQPLKLVLIRNRLSHHAFVGIAIYCNHNHHQLTSASAFRVELTEVHEKDSSSCRCNGLVNRI